MVRMFFRINSIIIITVASTLMILIQTSMAASLKEQEEALNMIAEFAERLCKDIPLEGQGSNLELTGKAKAELNGILNKLVNLGVEGAVKYQDTKYKGLLQKDLVRALKDSTNCKLQIWNDLKDSLLGPKTITPPVPPDPCTEYEPPNSDYIQEITKQAQNDSGAPPYITDVIRQAIYVGDFLQWVADCGKIQTTYERNIGNARYRVTPYAVYKDSYGRECREMSITKKVEGRWHGSSEIYCRVGGKWNVFQKQ